MQKIHPCLWFDGDVEEAMNFHLSVFKNSRVVDVARYPADPPGGPKKGEVMTATWEIEGQQITGLNGGPQFPFTEAVSLTIDCEDQAEVDYLWGALIAGGGQPVQCGWCTDRFGFSWQVVPRRLRELLGDPDRARAGRVMQAMLQMVKLDIAQLEAAAG